MKYVSDLDTPSAPKRSLKAFRRIDLQGGEEREEVIRLPGNAFESVNDEGEYVLSGRHFEVSIGFSAPDAQSVSLMGQSPITLSIEMQ